MAHLRDAADQAAGGLDIAVEVLIETARMRQDHAAPVRLSLGNARDSYWTVAQMVAHHSSNGCNLNPGDLCATGTLSGPDKSSFGSILELAWRGTQPIALPNGESRRFVEDGDAIILRARCSRPGAVSIGFGECRGVVEPAV
jgi:fumarylacetoacetase